MSFLSIVFRPLRLVGALAILGAASLNAQAPLTLFNGLSLLGWTPHGQWTASGGVLSTSGTLPRSILSAVPFGDYRLVFDYKESSTMGAKLHLGATGEGTGGTYVDLDGSSPGIGGIEGVGTSTIASSGWGTWRHVSVESSNGQITVHIDSSTSGSASRSGAGYLGWEAAGNGNLDIRNVKLIPLNLTSAFNNADLGMWKNVARKPAAKGGVGHDMEKTLTFGIGGGSTKAHDAKWSVQGGAIHGEDGPGGLEFTTPVSDALIQLQGSLKGQPKPEHYIGINLRGTAGQLDGGYPVGIGPFAGSIGNLAKHALASGSPVDQTIIIAHRTIAVWVAGNLYTVYTDSRPEASRIEQGARTAAGSATLALSSDVALDVKSISITPIAKSSSAPAPPPAASATTPTPAAASPAGGGAAVPAASSGSSATEKALVQQQQAAAKQADDDRQAKQRVASLMSLALSSPDPQKQVEYYGQVIAIDPSNAPAVQGYKDAQSKVQASQAAQDQKVAVAVNEQHDSLTKDQQVSGSLVKAQSAFLGGHVAEASSALAVAERLAPDNPLVRDLRSRINATSSLHSRLYSLAGVAGLLALLAAAALWLRRRRQQRYPELEVISGLDTGQHFPLEKDLVRIGAVAQDGGQKNDIVLQDVDRAISRFHCEIRKQNGQLYLTDLKSSNGTMVDGKPIEAGRPTLLRKGDRILLADVVELQFGYGRRKKA